MKKKKAPKIKTVLRVDPSTGRSKKVAEDSIEAIEWPTVAEYRSERKKVTKEVKKNVEAVKKLGEKAVEQVFQSPEVANYGRAAAGKVSAGSRAAAAGARKALSVGGGSAAAGIAALGTAGTVAAVGAAFAVGYGIGTAGVKLWNYLKPAERDYRKAQAFRAARKQWEQDKGRPMTTEEVKAMGRGFLDSLSTKR